MSRWSATEGNPNGHQAISTDKSACRKSSIASDCVLGSRHRDVAAGDCQFGWLQGVRNRLRQNSFWLQRLDLNLRNLSHPRICSRGRRVIRPYCPEWMFLGDFLVSLLVALGLSISGDLRRPVASRIFHISMKWHDLASSGNFGQTAPNGLKGRCSTTELRP